MTQRIWNFSAGPAVLPESVLEEARGNLLSLGSTGIGILEHSHRGKAFVAVYEETEALVRKVGGVPDNYRVLFLQGGASTQFFQIPMNFLSQDRTADYLVTGSWSEKAEEEARRFGQTYISCSSSDRNYSYIPATCTFSPNPAYAHYTSNNTIFGTQWPGLPPVPKEIDLICDASSDIFSRPIDVARHAMIYAGAQKNLGPSGVTLVIIRDDLIEKGPKNIPTMLQYRTHAKNDSMYNTPPTFAIYLVGLVLKWIERDGGLSGIAERNQRKAAKLYSFLDQSKLFKPTADANSRSLMNVTFVTGNADLDAKVCSAASKAGFDGLKGHRSVGGMRASIYNAFPEAGVDALVEFLKNFEAANPSA
ncbi:3-phosphoserine/phosphohydroxythreonine transaminase [Schlesneria sp. DSM 10557]|uniref:3-phosphoserine/phosphohydroxythreonine transaminase n=1 Tax=Schlesneria sp. DSM 10557 TaxID=3044399 RepID=UPI0035A06B2F